MPSTKCSTRSRLISSTDFKRVNSEPKREAVWIKDSTSFGKHEPPKPKPALRKSGEMRGSYPMPRATSSTFAPHASQILAMALMKETFVARKALEAYLIISAL